MTSASVKFAMSNPLRTNVLNLYRRILRVQQSWESAIPAETAADKQYILDEARMLFRQNKTLSDPEEIQECVNEGQARLELALHYRNPYPRPVNLPPTSLATGWKKMKAEERKRKMGKPVYVKSLDKSMK